MSPDVSKVQQIAAGLVKKYENYCFNNFDKILLFSKKEIDSIEKKYKKKLMQINFGIDNVKKKFRHHKNN